MTDYTLHCIVESGNAYKAALMLQLCGEDWQPLWLDFFKGAARSPEFLKMSNMAEIPVLIDHKNNDKAYSQSGVILSLLAERTGKFGGKDREEELEILRWLFWDNHKLTGNVSVLRVLKKFLNKGDGPEAAYFKPRVDAALSTLENHLSENEWVVGGRPTIADISICGYLFWPDHIDMTWKEHPSIAAWLERIKQLDNWAAPEALMPSGPKS